MPEENQNITIMLILISTLHYSVKGLSCSDKPQDLLVSCCLVFVLKVFFFLFKPENLLHTTCSAPNRNAAKEPNFVEQQTQKRAGHKNVSKVMTVGVHKSRMS